MSPDTCSTPGGGIVYESIIGCEADDDCESAYPEFSLALVYSPTLNLKASCEAHLSTSALIDSVNTGLLSAQLIQSSQSPKSIKLWRLLKPDTAQFNFSFS